MNALAAKLATLTTDTLADVCCGLMNDFRPEADAVFTAALNLLEKRMSSAEFIAFCNRMEQDAI